MVETGLHLDPQLVQDVVRATLVGLHGVYVGCELAPHLVLHLPDPPFAILPHLSELGLVAVPLAFYRPLDLRRVGFHVL